MAQLISVKLSRFDASPWGFRLQGGKDFGAPLLIQKVNGGSPAEKAGLQAGDAVIKVNDVELFNLRHKDAQDAIVRAGNNFEFTVQRGGSTWKPQVTPVGPTPAAFSPSANVQPVTKTSLAAKKPEAPHIGSSHNFAPKPFGGAQVNGIADPTVKSIVNKQYNTPVGMYSEETIAETLSAQAEVLAGGVLGVNFKKNEKTYNAANSEVLKMVQEIDSEPKTPEPDRPSSTTFFATASHAVGGRATSPRPLTPLAQQLTSPSAPSSYQPTFAPKCSDCDKSIVGVFVRIKDKNLHVECFKCATCGTSLKNVGYYNINNKLYCDIHAKLAARQNPPAPNLDPITVPPGGRAPAGAISAALGKAPGSNFGAPSNFGPPSNFAPAQARAPAPAPTYAPPPAPAPAPAPAPSSLAGPKPFSTPSAPTTSPARPAPAGSKFVWPPRDEEEITLAPTASPLYIPPSTGGSGPAAQPGHVPPQAPPAAAVKSVPAPAPQFPLPPPPAVQPPAPEVAPVSFPPSGVSKQTVPFPEPFSSYLAKQQLGIRPVSSPVPTEKQHPPGPLGLPEFAEPLLPQEPIAVISEESEEIQTAKDAAFHKKYSVCSQEVLAINKDKPGPSFEALSETLETQMLVSSLTPEPVKRPESPVPMQDSKTSSIQDLPSTTVEQPQQEQVKTIATETVPIQEPEPVPEPSIPAQISVEESGPTESFSQSIQSVEAKSEEVSAQSNTVNVSEQSFSSQKTEKKVEFSEVKSSSQVTTIEEKQVHSELVSALTSVTERLSPFPSARILSEFEVLSTEQSVVSESSSQAVSQSVSGFVPVSREQERSATEFQLHTRQISSQQSVPSAETVQSLPSHIFDREAACPSPMLQALTIAPETSFSALPSATVPLAPFPGQSRPLTTQTMGPQPFTVQAGTQPVTSAFPKPFVPAMVSALTIAPERPYSPLPSATAPTISASVQSAPINVQSSMTPAVPAPLPVSMQASLGPLTRDDSCPSPLLSALTVAPDCPYSPLPSATKPTISAPQQSAPFATSVQQGAYPTVVKPAPLPTSQFQPASIPPPSTAFKPMASAPVPLPKSSPFQPSSIPQPSNAFKPTSAPASLPTSQFQPPSIPQPSTAFKPMALAPAPLPKSSQFQPASIPQPSPSFKPASSAPAPLPLPHAPPSLKPVIPAPLAASKQGQPSLDREGTCPSPMLSALTIAPERPYSPLPSATKSLGYGPVQVPEMHTSAPIPAPIKFSPSAVPQQSLRDETQLPQLARPAQISKATTLASIPKLPQTKFPVAPKPEPVQPQVKPAASSSLPVIGGFRPIISPSTSSGFNPVQTSAIPPPSQPIPEQFAHPPRPETPVQRTASPTPHSRSATPHHSASKTGLQKPAAIPYYQQEMGEYPGQRPRSATPTCPMLEPRPQTPKAQLTKPETTAQHSLPYPNIPLPNGFKQESVTFKPVAHPLRLPAVPQVSSSAPVFKPSPQPASTAPIFKPSPLAAASQPASAAAPIFKPSPLAAASQPASAAAPIFKPSPLAAASQPASAAPIFKPSPLAALSQPASAAPIFKPSPLAAPSSLAAPQPTSIAPALKPSPLAAPKFAPESAAPTMATQPSSVAKTPSVPSSSSIPNAGGGGGGGAPGQKGATFAGSTAPRRGRGVLTQQSSVPGGRIPLCAHCNAQIRGPFITALGKNWCPEHFVCVNAQCRRPLADIGFVEEKGELYCEYCFEKYLAPTCDKCNKKIKGDCLNAIGKHFHPECFLCAYCGKLFGNNPFFLEDGLPYCEADWNELFTTKCFACGFPIEAGDRWVEALNNNYHSQCFNCTNCKKNLEGQSFYAKGGRPFCKAHAR